MSFPFNSGMTSPTALAAPVLEGMMFTAAAQRPIGVFVNLVGDALVVRVSVDGRHQALLDSERLMKHLGHRRQAVGGA